MSCHGNMTFCYQVMAHFVCPLFPVCGIKINCDYAISGRTHVLTNTDSRQQVCSNILLNVTGQTDSTNGLFITDNHVRSET